MGLKSPFYVSNSLINNLVQPRHLEVTRSEGDWFGYVEKIEAIALTMMHYIALTLRYNFSKK